MTVDEVREAYSDDAGPRLKKLINHNRFPFTFHHDEVRVLYDSPPSRSDVDSATIALFDGDAYVEDVCRGAFAHITRVFAEEMLLDLAEACEGSETKKVVDLYKSICAQAKRWDRKTWEKHFAKKEG